MDELRVSISSPVSRTLPIADLARTREFYRQVLGFQVNDEAVYGPARLQFEVEAAPKAAMVFFETSNLDGMHAGIKARGGTVSAINQVNWIKMRMFEVHDPDGHILWYGQRYDQPDQIKPSLMFEKALPQFPVSEMSAAVAYYREILGFRVNYQQFDLGVMDRDKVTLVLVPKEGRERACSYFYVVDADALFAELQSKGANVQGAPISHPWGLRDFGIVDPDGNQLRFGQAFE